MPQTVRVFSESEWKEITIATESELLEFANSVRRVGGADILEALLPSIPSDSLHCLIANALNFSCVVRGVHPRRYYESGCPQWAMIPHQQTNGLSKNDLAQEIADALGLETIWNTHDSQEPATHLQDFFELQVILPETIGNAALAFDQRVAFQDFIPGCQR